MEPYWHKAEDTTTRRIWKVKMELQEIVTKMFEDYGHLEQWRGHHVTKYAREKDKGSAGEMKSFMFVD